MTDLECMEYAIQIVLRNCRENTRNFRPPSIEEMFKWLAQGINEAKKIRDK